SVNRRLFIRLLPDEQTLLHSGTNLGEQTTVSQLLRQPRSLRKRLLYRVSRSRAARNGYPVLVDDDSRRLTKRLAAGLRLHRENAAATDDDVIDVESVTLYVVKDVPPVRSELLQMIGNYPLPVASQFQQTRLIDE